MFKLQRLEITGFKSFADYTEIVFTGNGITAVVGPNGCGKSNVSDSISWVLGEQRAKSLRGAEMKDVVFQGTKDRKPSGMAEVVLHLVRDEEAFDIEDAELEDIDEALSNIDELAVDVDALEAAELTEAETPVIEQDATATVEGETNGFHAEEVVVERVQAAQVGSVQTVERTVKTKRHWRPRSFALDFAPGEAVSVSRRLYLSGESEYLLNGKTCRLRDIQDLFAGTGLSGAHYAIVEQGRIGQILSAKPADRRNLIEEAAGISKFRTRQRAAESRLESAKSNLSRITDIVSEVEKQANSLRRQAAKTRRFLVLQDEFRVLLRRLFAAEGRHLDELIKQLYAELETAGTKERELALKVTEQEESSRSATREARAAEESLSAIRSKHSQNALERDRAEREHRYQSEQIVDLTARAESIEIEISATEERCRVAEAETTRLQLEDEKESSEADASRLILVEAEKQYSTQVDEVRKIESDMDARRSELMQHTAAIERIDELVRQLEFNSERLSERASGLDHEGIRAEEAYQDHLAEAERVATELKDEKLKLDGLAEEKASLIAAAKTAREKLDRSEADRTAVAEKLNRSRNRLETLQELEETRAVYAPQVQKVFAERENISAPLGGVLADFLNVSEKAETAVECIFGPYLQSIVVHSREAALEVSEWIKANNVGRVPVLILPEDLTAAERIGEISLPATLDQLLGAAPELKTVLREAFPREMSATVVESLGNEHNASGDTFASLAGDVLYGSSLLISGRAVSGEKNESLLAFKRELGTLAKEADRLATELADAAAVVDADRSSLAKVEEKTVDLQSLIIKVERHVLALELQETTARQEIERAVRHKKVVVDESEQVAAELDAIRKRIHDAKESYTAAVAERTKVKSALDEIAECLAEARDRAEVENTSLSEKRTLAATSSERRRAVQKALERVANEERDLHERIRTLQQELEQTNGRLAELRESVAAIGDRISKADSEIDVEKTELAVAMTTVEAARAAADEASEVLAALNKQAAEAMNERSAIEVRRTEAVTELRNLAENCVQELNTELKSLVETEELPEEFVLEAAREQERDLRERLEGFGAINMLAVDELAEAEERLLFLTSQRQDIVESIASAEEALREIKERSRERFKNAFEAINENFRVYFSELFGGGRGEMTLLEADDILEAGIEVSAQPPGKRLQNILLLSGGEKAMTAIALVLAIFKYRPSPFCLLDEVDAPLDDANVGRFVNKIADMSEKTQFIVITHNKRTMEAARALYGVTMQEPGVSKVVSVKFE